MNLPLLPFLRLLLIQVGMTLLIVLPFHVAQADEETITLKQHINTYVYEGDTLDLSEEMEITQEDKVVQVSIKAQAIEHNAKLNLVINGSHVKTALLEDNLKEIQFKLAKNEKLKKLEIHSKGAFVRMAKAKLVSQEQDNSGILSFIGSTSQEPPPQPHGSVFSSFF